MMHHKYSVKAIAYGVELETMPSYYDGECLRCGIQQIIAQIKAKKVPAIFASKVFPNDVTERIADEAHVEVVRTLRDDVLPGDIGASQHTYIGMMIANVRAMVTALGAMKLSLKKLIQATHINRDKSTR